MGDGYNTVTDITFPFGLISTYVFVCTYKADVGNWFGIRGNSTLNKMFVKNRKKFASKQEFCIWIHWHVSIKSSKSAKERNFTEIHRGPLTACPSLFQRLYTKASKKEFHHLTDILGLKTGLMHIQMDEMIHLNTIVFANTWKETVYWLVQEHFFEFHENHHKHHWQHRWLLVFFVWPIHPLQFVFIKIFQELRVFSGAKKIRQINQW